MLDLHFVGYRHDMIGEVCDKEPDVPHLVDESCKLVADGKTVGYIFKNWDKSDDVLNVVSQLKYSKSRRTLGMYQQSKVFGFMPRNAIRCNYCRPSEVDRKQPEFAKVLRDFGAKITSKIMETDVSVYQQNMDIVKEQVEKHYILPKTIFTSGIVNKNNPLAYHCDSGNFEGTWTAMLVYKNEVKGGNLHLPEFDAVIKLDDGDLVIFKSSDYVHGVTPIIKLGQHSYRYSVVYYTLKGLAQCLPPKEEMARYKKWASTSFLEKKEREEKLKKHLGNKRTRFDKK